MKSLLFCGALFSLVLFPVKSVAVEKDLLLIGGGLKICSSYSSKNCAKNLSYQNNAYTSTYYSVNPISIKTISEDAYKSFTNKKLKEKVVSLLKKYQLRFSKERVTRRKLLKRLDHLKLTTNQQLGREILDSLTPTEWNFIFHNLTVPVVDETGKALTEFVNLEHSNPYSIKIIDRFVSLAKTRTTSKKPLILVSTASANNPFDAVSFYIQLFSQFEVDVAWLPIDANLNAILNSDKLDCGDLNRNRSLHFQQFNRDKIYPTLTKYQTQFCDNPNYLDELISRANGLFINGGDQFLTLSAFTDPSKQPRKYSKYYLMLKERFDKGELVVAGTSAGSAVQSGGVFESKSLPMVTNGESKTGLFKGAIATNLPPSKRCSVEKNCENNTNLKSLTYLEKGGFDLLPIGLIDTHFSERDRLLRLTRLMADTDASIGFGIDENTALHINQVNGNNRLSVVGESGVWKVKLQDKLNEATKAQQKTESVEALSSRVEILSARESLHADNDTWLGDNIIANMIKKASSNQSRLAREVLDFEEYSAELTLELNDKDSDFTLEIRIE